MEVNCQHTSAVHIGCNEKFLPGKGKLVICCCEDKDAKKESGSQLPWGKSRSQFPLENQNLCFLGQSASQFLGENCKNFTLYHHLLRLRAVEKAAICTPRAASVILPVSAIITMYCNCFNVILVSPSMERTIWHIIVRNRQHAMSMCHIYKSLCNRQVLFSLFFHYFSFI